MDGHTLIGALERIEAALDRIEQSAARPRQPVKAEESALAQRHAALQGDVATALSRIDALLGGRQP